MKKKYCPPVSVNLSRASVTGQVQPEGICYNGLVPYAVCTVGDTVPSQDCYAGTEGANCSNGTSVKEMPRCQKGSMAITGCYPGSDA